jgi:hypothetical protein
MKKIIQCLLLILIIVFIECKSFPKQESGAYQNSIECDTLLRGDKIETANVRIYNVDPAFYIFLDTIIKSETKCPYYNKCNSGFLFSTSLFSSSPDVDEIAISSLNISTYDYSKSYGIFNYQGYRFVCDSLCNKELLQETDKNVLIKFVISKNKKGLDIDDRFSSWYFVYLNKKLSLNSHHPCYIPDDTK